MERPERRIHRVLLALAIGTTALPLAVTYMRTPGVARHIPFLDLLFLVSIPFFFAAPLTIVGGIAHALSVRFKMARTPEAFARPRAGPRAEALKPSVLLFCVCGVFWIYTRYAFKLVPLFAGETRVQRSFLDGWLDKLL